eukprot:CAMPEP_0115087670 /NCGR_PEP_ID=MMETSP0227-20121206/23463_1 /TAXON_ID=89957 /ORGANISM="Polarella glacialis, Strain CCMP 1383" /LENGTH=107 /DNA_ID=CAMNT_0002477651 /DNA_START=316 /DNA_END=639 /DNA_ORIENTATION=+
MHILAERPHRPKAVDLHHDRESHAKVGSYLYDAAGEGLAQVLTGAADNSMGRLARILHQETIHKAAHIYPEGGEEVVEVESDVRLELLPNAHKTDEDDGQTHEEEHN